MAWVSELWQWMALVKMAAAIAMVVTLSVLAEVVSPRFAGVLSGYPLGAAISLFFMGLEISPDFAAQSATYTMTGLIATQMFAFGYYRISVLTLGFPKAAGMICAALGGLAGFFLVTWLCHLVTFTRWLAVLVAALAIPIFTVLFRRIPNVRIQNRAPLTFAVVLLRSLIAGFFVVIITSTASLVGPRWAGLFAALPITMLPFVMIIHHTYQPEHVHAILKNVPRGLGSLLVYALAVSWFYPGKGVALGTLIAYGFATAYLAGVQGVVSLRTIYQAKQKSQIRFDHASDG
jgi:hypothetical protein